MDISHRNAASHDEEEEGRDWPHHHSESDGRKYGIKHASSQFDHQLIHQHCNRYFKMRGGCNKGLPTSLSMAVGNLLTQLYRWNLLITTTAVRESPGLHMSEVGVSFATH